MSADDTFPTRLDELAFLLEEVPRSLRRKLDERLNVHGLSRTHWRILAYVLRDPGMSQTELARCLELERMTISLALDKMEVNGLVKRERSSKDGRMQLVNATAKARALLPKIRLEADATYTELLRDMPEEHITELQSILKMLAANLRRSD